jgi:hypothetical protein
VCKVVLVASNGLVEGLAVRIAAEVEALAPAVLVQIGRQVVVVSCEGGIFVSSLLEGISICISCWSTASRVPCVSPRSRLQPPCCPSA